MDKYLDKIPPKPPPLSAIDALIIHAKAEKKKSMETVKNQIKTVSAILVINHIKLDST